LKIWMQTFLRRINKFVGIFAQTYQHEQ
jgi:hypothetical protein